MLLYFGIIYESVEIWLNWIDFFFILNDVMIDLYLYDDGIVFDHDCDSCEIKCIDIKLFVKCRKIEIWIWVWKY